MHQPGLYRIIWDNTYSWFTKKKIRFRVSVLKPIDITNKDKDKQSVLKNVITSQSDVRTEEKSLILSYEGRKDIYELPEIRNKIKAVKSNATFYVSVPVFITRDMIRIFDNNAKVFNEYRFSQQNDSFEDFSENILLKLIKVN